MASSPKTKFFHFRDMNQQENIPDYMYLSIYVLQLSYPP